MIRIIKYKDEYINQWNDCVSTSKKNIFMFNRGYMDYHRDRFIDHSLMFYNDNKLLACLPACERDDVFVTHAGLTYGGMITCEDMKQHIMNECFIILIDYLKNAGFKRIIWKIVPYFYYKQPSDEEKYSLYINNAKLLKIEASTLLNLKNPLNMAVLRKRMIKKAQKNGVVICEEISKKSYDEYISLLNNVLLDRHGVKAVHTADELFLLYSRFPDNIKLIVARLDNSIIAGAIVYEYDSVVHTQYLAANDESRKNGALDYVISYTIDKYKDIKNWLDFGISTENDGLLLNDGLISQKEGFGGRTAAYETWELLLK